MDRMKMFIKTGMSLQDDEPKTLGCFSLLLLLLAVRIVASPPKQPHRSGDI